MQQIASYIQQSFYKVYEFNDLAGNFNCVDGKSLENQCMYIQEELNETLEAIFKGDEVEVIDGACDLWVTVCGLMQKLEAMGFDVKTAMQRVDDNNLQKFPKSMDDVTYSPDFNVTRNDKYMRYVIKDQSGKVRKFDNFPKVDLSDLVPKE